MKSYNQRVVTYLSEKYKKKLEEICADREEKEALIVREILKEYFDAMEKYTRRKVTLSSTGQSK